MQSFALVPVLILPLLAGLVVSCSTQDEDFQNNPPPLAGFDRKHPPVMAKQAKEAVDQLVAQAWQQQKNILELEDRAFPPCPPSDAGPADPDLLKQLAGVKSTYAQTLVAAEEKWTSLDALDKYTLRANDTISVFDPDNAQYDETGTISADGTLTLTRFDRLAPVKIAGLTTQEGSARLTAAALAGKYADALKLILFIKKYAPHQIKILGEVERPGAVALSPEEPPTLVTAVAAAGSVTVRASRYATITTTLPAGAQQRVGEVDLWLAFKDPGSDVPLRDGDTIFLPQALIGGVPESLVGGDTTAAR